MSESPEFDPAVQELWRNTDPPGGMALGWFIAVEGLDEDGKRSLDFMWSEGLKTYQLKGYLNEALDTQVEQTIIGELQED